ILEKIFKTRTRAEWLQILETKGMGMAFSAINELTELTGDAQIMANDYIIDIEHPTLGKIKMTGFPFKFSETPTGVWRTAPQFGQHTEEVLMDLLGFTWEDLEKLKEAEVI
ncbi:MAG: CoA transferase, partial [Dehalococcoidales bacterium]|nr:CoA transferase [Dehalococcoidales bacterium]